MPPLSLSPSKAFIEASGRIRLAASTWREAVPRAGAIAGKSAIAEMNLHAGS
jgi:hypothetical protein